MVRLVFRPYTQVWRTICTSVPLRASTRVSPGFTLLKHSSPSFGSYQICSCSYPSQKIWDGRCCRLRLASYSHFHCAYGFPTRKLAYVIDSLVRVSRRVGKSHFGKINYFPQAQDPFALLLLGTLDLTLPSSWVSRRKQRLRELPSVMS